MISTQKNHMHSVSGQEIFCWIPSGIWNHQNNIVLLENYFVLWENFDKQLKAKGKDTLSQRIMLINNNLQPHTASDTQKLIKIFGWK